MSFGYRLARAALFRLDAEDAHDKVIAGARWAQAHPSALHCAKRLYAPPVFPALEIERFGLRFAHPIGLAAGLDKNGVGIDFWAALGFGFVEVGTVTPGAGQPGNERPRLVRVVEDQAIVNRMGFNNFGAPALAAQLAARKSKIPVGANLGKAKATANERATDDYLESLSVVFDHADYLVVNVSSPNTPGLRDLQAVSALGPLLSAVQSENERLGRARGIQPRPLLLKVAPDLSDEDLDGVADLAEQSRLAGLIATNTTLSRAGLQREVALAGGLSGPPLGARALECTRRLYRRLEGRLPIIGVGGITTAEDAYARIRAGASLLQIYTAFIYQGPALISRLVGGLAACLRRDGLDSLMDAVGRDA